MKNIKMVDESCTAEVGASEASEPCSGRDHSSEIERMDRKAANSVRGEEDDRLHQVEAWAVWEETGRRRCKGEVTGFWRYGPYLVHWVSRGCPCGSL